MTQQRQLACRSKPDRPAAYDKHPHALLPPVAHPVGIGSLLLLGEHLDGSTQPWCERLRDVRLADRRVEQLEHLE